MAHVTIDMLTEDPDSGEVVAYLTEPGPWPNTDEGWAETLHRIQERVFDAVHLLVQGSVVERFPQVAGKPARIQLDCPNGVPSPVTELVADLRKFLGRDPEYSLAIAKTRHHRGVRLVTGAEV